MNYRGNKDEGYPGGVTGRDSHFDMPSTEDGKDGRVLVKVRGARCRLHPENVERLRKLGYTVEELD